QAILVRKPYPDGWYVVRVSCRGDCRRPAACTSSRHAPSNWVAGGWRSALGRPIGLYSAERSLVDIVRLRHREGSDVAWEALRRWLGQPGRRPAQVMELAANFPRAEPALRRALEVLL